MQLTKAEVRRYRSINETGPFNIQPDITSLVGKNESGKTAVLQSLNKSNSYEGVKFDIGIDYPTSKTQERRKAEGSIPVTTLTYMLSDNDVAAVEQELGPGSLSSNEIKVTTYYDCNKSTWDISVDQSKVLDYLRSKLDLPSADQESVDACSNIEDLSEALNNLTQENSDATKIINTISGWRNSSAKLQAIDILKSRRPKFVYFSEYDTMPGEININNLISKRDNNNLTRGENAFLSLLNLVDIELEDLSNPESSEHLIREVENASNGITDEVFQYWTQNQNLRVQLNIKQDTAANSVEPMVQIRILNEKHHVTVPFDERSRGFVWFFSFLAYFSEIEHDSETPLILLLDEPGLSLHAKAQADLIRFIDERLAPKHQVIFTTHSPFMVDANKLERVRTVEDKDSSGTIVSSDILKAQKDTVFPLLAAMGIGLTQTLWVGSNVLLVEGPSDVVFLNYLSEALRNSGRVGLDERWVITPAGGITKLPSFLSLFNANKMNVATLTDSSKRDNSTLIQLRNAGKLGNSGIIQIGEILGKEEADLEDIFTPAFYLNLINTAYAGALKGKKIKVSDLSTEEKRLTMRVEKYFKENNIGGGTLNHFSPANVLMKRLAKTSKVAETTLNYAEELFKKINDLLPS